MKGGFDVSVVCSSQSVNRWWSEFLSYPVVSYLFWPLNSQAVSHEDMLLSLTTGSIGTKVYFILSEHESLERDAKLVMDLRMQGHIVVGAGSCELCFELDKITAKSLFSGFGVPTPSWSLEPLVNTPMQLLKGSRGTEGREICWHETGKDAVHTDSLYYEDFVEGTEYSVIVLKSRTKSITLPPVWKGETDRLLNPPYKRLRLCGPGVVSDALDSRLRETAIHASQLVAGPCVIEVEFVVSFSGQLLVLEINPRIAGTTRMAALAADVPFLDLCLSSEQSLGNIPAVRYVAELPVEVEGSSIVLGNDIYASKRMTLAGDSWTDVGELLAQAQFYGWCLNAEASSLLREMVVQKSDSNNVLTSLRAGDQC